jgi:hypothetical protein
MLEDSSRSISGEFGPEPHESVSARLCPVPLSSAPHFRYRRSHMSDGTRVKLVVSGEMKEGELEMQHLEARKPAPPPPQPTLNYRGMTLR